MKRVALTSLIVFFFILIATTIAILYGRGYTISPENGKTRLEGTGLLVLTSKPDASKVFINDHLTTATNNTLNLQPGEYTVKITHEGYFPWQKKIVVQKEIVSRADATLFPTAPKLNSITLTGASNPVVDESGTMIAYTVSGNTTQKNGVYILTMNSNLLSFGNSTSQITDDSIDAFSKATLEFSPDGKNLTATISGKTTYLLTTSGMNNSPQDVTATLLSVQKDWEKIRTDKRKSFLNSLGKKVSQLVIDDFKNPVASLDEEKIVYEASRSAYLSLVTEPRIIGVNSTPEQRSIREGDIYVYDVKEDRNYLLFARGINQEAPRFIWFPDSRHLMFIKDKKINVVEFDNQNEIAVYAGPFEDTFAFPWPDGSNLVILTNLNLPDAPLNLYTLSLK